MILFSILSIKGWEIILKINCCINQIIFRWRKTYTSLNMYKDNDKNINWNLKSIKLLLWCLTSYGYIVARFVLLCSQFLILIHNIVVLYRSQHPSKGRKKAWKFEGGGGSSNVSPLIKIHCNPLQGNYRVELLHREIPVVITGMSLQSTAFFCFGYISFPVLITLKSLLYFL